MKAKHITTKEAAAIIGCNARHVRSMIADGTLPATRHDMPGGYYYTVVEDHAVALRDTKQSKGWPRGVSRSE